MSVVIEEMVHERAEEPTRAPVAPSTGGGAASPGGTDLNQVENHLARRRQRAERVWAD